MPYQLSRSEVTDEKWALVEAFVRAQRVARAKAAKRASHQAEDLSAEELDPIVPAVDCRRTRERLSRGRA